MDHHLKHIDKFIESISSLTIGNRVDVLNVARRRLHESSPFRDEPVDCVEWVPTDFISANDYNPNSVASPEMKLLELSITADGYPTNCDPLEP